MTEERLQSEIVKRYSEIFGAERNGCLFHIANERNSKLQAFKARAIGIVPGVSDLIEIYNGKIKCLELKVSGSRHKVSQLRKQVKWGRKMVENGAEWRLITNVEDAILFFQGLKNDGMTLEYVEDYLRRNDTKTVKI